MKIVFIHDFFSTKIGKEFYSTGFPYKIWERYLTTFDELTIMSRMKTKSVNTDFLPLSSGSNVHFSPINQYTSIKSFVKNYQNIKKHMEEIIEEQDGVIIRLPSVLGFLAANICIKNKKKFCVEVVGSAFNAFWYHSLFSKIVALPAEILQKRAVKESAVAIYITENYLQKKYPTKNKMFSNVSNVTINSESMEKTLFNKDKNSKYTIGLVGSTFVNYKGHNTALKSLKSLNNQGYNIHLDLVGQGPSKQILNTIKTMNLENEVNIIGMINSREKMNEWYRSLDFYIQPSFTEGHGRAVVEAIDNGVPSFGSNVGGLPDSISNKYLFTKKKSDELTELIKKGIHDKDFLLDNIKDNQKNIQKYNKELVEKRRYEALQEYKSMIKGI